MHARARFDITTIHIAKSIERRLESSLSNATPNQAGPVRSIRALAAAGVVWLALWVVPWNRLPDTGSASVLTFAGDMARLGVALGMFMFPGVLLFALLRSPSHQLMDSCGIIPIGFALSVAMIGLIGLAARLAGASFSTVKYGFCAAGLLELLLLWGPRGGALKLRSRLRDLAASLGSSTSLVVALIVSAAAMIVGRLFFIDDTSYLAYLTDWQHSTHLGFGNIIYGLSVPESPRFWLALYPMGQALMAEASGLPGILLIGSYLEFLLVPIAVIASFWFARILGLSRRAAGFSALIQVCLYTWMVGRQWPAGFWFYQNMSEDKVTGVYILAPVLFAFALQYLRAPNVRGLVLILLSGMALALTHPVSQFFSIVIVLALALIALMVRSTTWRHALWLAMTVTITLIPYALIRYSARTAEIGIPFDAASASASFEIARYTRLVGGMFYGLNPDVLRLVELPIMGRLEAAYQAFRWLPVIIVALGALVALVQIRRGPLQWYVLACAGLIGAATLPFTGWLLGYFVSARLISRSSWFLPVGLAAVLIIEFALLMRAGAGAPPVNSPSARGRAARNYYELAGIVGCLIFISPIMGYAVLPGLPVYVQKLDHYRALASIGAQIDARAGSPVTVLAVDYDDNQLLPGVAARARLISFREEVDRDPHNYTLPLSEINDRKHASSIIRSAAGGNPEGEACSSVLRYELKFIIAQKAVTPTLRDHLHGCGVDSTISYSIDDLDLVQIQ